MPAFTQTRPVLDIGLFSDNPAMPKFYADELELPFFEGIQHSPTYEERFYELNGAWLKINYSDEPMAAGRSGYRELVIAKDDLVRPRSLTDPDGLAIRLVPRGTDGVTHLGVGCAVADVEAERRFLVDALGAGRGRTRTAGRRHPDRARTRSRRATADAHLAARLQLRARLGR